MSGNANDAIAAAWRESARFWEQYRDHLLTMLAPLTAAIVADAAIAEGDTILDAAGGPGEPALTVARYVGERGRVVTTDIAPEMVAASRRASERTRASNLRFAVCSAQALPFADRAFDGVVCRLGIMFVPDPIAALRDMARVTKPGGRVCLVVWGAHEHNPYFRVPSAALAAYLPSEPDPPGAPGAWRYSEAGSLADDARAAGLDSVVERALSFAIELPIDFEAFWPMRIELSDTLRAKIARLDERARRNVTEAVRDATASYFHDGRMSMPAEARIVRGTVAPA